MSLFIPGHASICGYIGYLHVDEFLAMQGHMNNLFSNQLNPFNVFIVL